MKTIYINQLKPFLRFSNILYVLGRKLIWVRQFTIASFVETVYLRTMAPVNIAAAFEKTGRFPLEGNVFSKEDVIPIQVTERRLVDLFKADSKASNSSAKDIQLEPYFHQVMPSKNKHVRIFVSQS